ncbi:hypothetical protein EVAR_11717_1 [Eumeta japonica]|uniref:Uncharacterized protein n=1 Tax=Eumeta variegata TaxID=151549 RepID=A0A4C1U4S6_EUMVA|nr:hypothetical protein EVAR_11717_1 [Eumeta japonica]
MKLGIFNAGDMKTILHNAATARRRRGVNETGVGSRAPSFKTLYVLYAVSCPRAHARRARADGLLSASGCQAELSRGREAKQIGASRRRAPIGSVQ